jgi:hypothetical protein
MTVRIGQIVLYRLTATDAEAINRRRIALSEIAERLQTGTWPRGAQAHVGSTVVEGDDVPLVVTRLREVPPSAGPSIIGLLSGQALLNGTDTFYVEDAGFGPEHGRWRLLDA